MPWILFWSNVMKMYVLGINCAFLREKNVGNVVLNNLLLGQLNDDFFLFSKKSPIKVCAKLPKLPDRETCKQRVNSV